MSSVDSTWEATAVASEPSPHDMEHTTRIAGVGCVHEKGQISSSQISGIQKIIFPNILLQFFKHIFGLPVIDLPLNKYDCERKEVCLLEPPQPAVVYFFQAGVNLSIENAKFWPILTNFGYFLANLRTFRCTFYRP